MKPADDMFEESPGSRVRRRYFLDVAMRALHAGELRPFHPMMTHPALAHLPYVLDAEPPAVLVSRFCTAGACAPDA